MMTKENVIGERKSSIVKWILALILLLMCFGSFSIVSDAATTIKSGTIKVEADSFYNIFFKLPKSGVVSVDMEISLEKYTITSSKDKLTFVFGEPYEDADIIGDYQKSLLHSAGEDFDRILEKDPRTIETGYIDATVYGDYYYADILDKGEYLFQIQNHSIHKYTIKYTIREYSGIATSFSTSSINATAGKEKALKVSTSPSDALIPIDSIKVNSKKLEYYYKDNSIYIYSAYAGTYKMTLTLTDGYSKTITIKVKSPDKLKLRYKSYTLTTGDSFKNALISTKKTVIWSSSNKKVATVNKNGKVTAKGVGSANITAKVGSKKYVCKVKVKRATPNFYAKVTDYNISKNYFTVKFSNKGSKPLTILTTGAKAMNYNYSSYNRDLNPNNGSKKVIQPGKSATVKFYVKGSTTWYNYKNYDIEYKFKYDSKKYTGHVWSTDSNYKKSGAWYVTYYDLDAFAEWVK